MQRLQTNMQFSADGSEQQRDRDIRPYMSVDSGTVKYTNPSQQYEEKHCKYSTSTETLPKHS